MIEIGAYTIDLVQLSSIFEWMFIGGALGMIGCFLLVFLSTFLTVLDTTASTIVGALGIFVSVFVAATCKYVCIVGGIGWLAVWILTSVGV